MINLSFLSHFVYLFMEIYIIGAVAFVLWAFHFRFLWAHRFQIVLGMILVTAYALPLDAIAVWKGWGSFNPVFVTGIRFFQGTLYLEEIIFWLGTSFVTISAVAIFAELEENGLPGWALPLGVVVPLGILISWFSPGAGGRSQIVGKTLPPTQENPP